MPLPLYMVPLFVSQTSENVESHVVWAQHVYETNELCYVLLPSPGVKLESSTIGVIDKVVRIKAFNSGLRLGFL